MLFRSGQSLSEYVQQRDGFLGCREYDHSDVDQDVYHRYRSGSYHVCVSVPAKVFCEGDYDGCSKRITAVPVDRTVYTGLRICCADRDINKEKRRVV